MSYQAIEFNPDKFKRNYPQFLVLDDEYLTDVFYQEAVGLGQSVIACVSNKSYWAQIVLAHILTVTGKIVGNQQTGRVSQATEDISGSFDYPTTLSNAWWDQTAYGQKCWQIIEKSGGFRYIPNEDSMYNGPNA